MDEEPDAGAMVKNRGVGFFVVQTDRVEKRWPDRASLVVDMNHGMTNEADMLPTCKVDLINAGFRLFSL